MNYRFNFFVISLLAALLSACSLFDSGIEWREGPYALIWIDTSENVSLSRELSDGNWIGRVDSTVFAVGWDGHYAVAKQHPHGDKSKTNYFILDSKNDVPTAEVNQVVIGPLTESEYQQKSIELNLPKFTKVLASLQ